MTSRSLVALLGADPLPWVLASDEPYAVWVAHALVEELPPDSAEVVAAHAAVVADPRVAGLVSELPGWGDEDFSGHHSPQFLPNRLNLLADMGVCAGDFAEVDALLDALLDHQDDQGRFEAFGRAPGRPKPEWGSLLCDTNSIADVLLRFGRGTEPRVGRALSRISADLAATPQGRAWQCVPDRGTTWRGPGRKADVCPQVTLEGLRAFSQVRPSKRPKRIVEAARTPLEVWRRRGDERPYQFGHGYQFKSVKWPNFWYDVLWVLDTVSRYPELWRGPSARQEDRDSIAEMAACLIAYNFDEDGRVTPRRTYRGFEGFSFGRKNEPSPFATARCLAVLGRLTYLAHLIAAVDVAELPSSVGGSGTARPPARPFARPREEPACPVPRPAPEVTLERAVQRVLARHHLVPSDQPASVESVVSDLVGIQATAPSGPYIALFDRLPGFTADRLDDALFHRRSLVRYRCMRGTVFVLRPDLLPVVHAATSAQVVRYARRFAEHRGITPDLYGALSERVLAALRELGPMTAAQLRATLRPDADLSAAVALMTAEGLLLADRPLGSQDGRRLVYVPLADALPDVRLGSVRDTDANVALVRAYLRAFGPASYLDTVWWTGLGRLPVTRALKRLGDEVVEVTLQGAEGPYLVHAADVDELGYAGATTSPHVVLLPPYDPLPMGYADKGRLIADAARPFLFDRGGSICATVLVDGRIAGVWDTVAVPRPTVLVHLFAEPPALVRTAVERAAESLGRFRHGADVDVTWVDTVTPLAERPAGSVLKCLR